MFLICALLWVCSLSGSWRRPLMVTTKRNKLHSTYTSMKVNAVINGKSTATTFTRDHDTIFMSKNRTLVRILGIVVPMVLGLQVSNAESISLGEAVVEPTKPISTVAKAVYRESNYNDGAVSAVSKIISDNFAVLRSVITSEKVAQLRVGDSLVLRLRAVEVELEALQVDIFRDPVDWEVLSVYPKVFRAYAPLFTTYTDRAFPTDSQVDKALRYALRYEVGGFYTSVKDLEDSINRKSIRAAQRAFAKMSLSYDRYLKAGDLYVEYEPDNTISIDVYKKKLASDLTGVNPLKDGKLNYIAPSIEAPGLQDEIILLRGPDKGRKGQVLWISKGDSIRNVDSVVVKLEASVSGHKEVKSYPYSLVAKTTPPEVLFIDDFIAAYLASAISSGIMYPIDTYKTRVQSGRKGIPSTEEGGFFGLWRGVEYFIADANDAVYLASYGLFKPVLINSIDTSSSLVVFGILTLAGSLGDAVGSFFRVPMEIVYKQIQTGASNNGLQVLGSLVQKSSFRLLAFSWVAVLCRDMPFAGLQIALFDLYKSVFSFLDDAGVSIFLQRSIWGAFAGGTAAFLTTPFDLITTNVMVAATDVNQDSGSKSKNVWTEIGPLFSKTTKETIDKGGINALFTGALPRVLFFAPAATIFFVSYESIFDILEQAKEGNAFFQR